MLSKSIGIMFDLSAKRHLLVTAISFGFSTAEPVSYKVLWRTGSHKSHEVGSRYLQSILIVSSTAHTFCRAIAAVGILWQVVKIRANVTSMFNFHPRVRDAQPNIHAQPDVYANNTILISRYGCENELFVS